MDPKRFISFILVFFWSNFFYFTRLQNYKGQKEIWGREYKISNWAVVGPFVIYDSELRAVFVLLFMSPFVISESALLAVFRFLLKELRGNASFIYRVFFEATNLSFSSLYLCVLRSYICELCG